jgi:hypothetical protein
MPVFEAFFNMFLEPRQYADFVNTTGTAYLEHAANPYVKASLRQNPALSTDDQTLKKVEFLRFVGEATATYSQIWDQFKNA